MAKHIGEAGSPYIGLYLPPDDKLKALELARATERTVSGLMRWLLRHAEVRNGEIVLRGHDGEAVDHAVSVG
jgi:hypothetical protein